MMSCSDLIKFFYIINQLFNLTHSYCPGISDLAEIHEEMKNEDVLQD